MAGCWLYRKLFSPFRVLLFFISFLFLYFLPCTLLVIVLCCTGYIYIFLGGIDPSSKIYRLQERPIDIVGEKFFAAGCMDAAVQKIYIYIIYTQKFVSYIILYGRKERRKRNGEEEKKTENPLLNHDLLVVCSIILSVFRSADI